MELIGDSAFEGSGLKSVTIPSSVKQIGSGAFEYCKSLKTVTMGGANSLNEVTTIGYRAFSGCDSLETVKLGAGVRVIDQFLSGDSALKNVEIGPKATSLEVYAFTDNAALSNLVIPDSVKIIKSDAFRWDKLSTLTIGKGVKVIEGGAFNYATVSKINYAGSESDWDKIEKNGWAPSNDIITFNYDNNIDYESDTKLTSTSASLKAGGSKRIEITSGIVKKWTASNKNVSVKEGTIKGLKKGSAVVTATLSGGKKLKCTVKVTTNPSLNKTKASVKKGKKFTLKVSGKATSAKFASSNKKIAVVSKSGVIKGVSKGKVTIKVAVNGVTLKCIVTVK